MKLAMEAVHIAGITVESTQEDNTGVAAVENVPISVYLY
jgi:hypothetical protein